MSSEVVDSSSYQQWRNEFARDRLRTLYYLGLAANPVFLISDLLCYRDQLAAIGGFVDNLLDGITGPLTDKQRRYLDRIKSNISRLVRMINDLHNLSNIEAGTVRLDSKTFVIADLAESLVDNLQVPARGKPFPCERPLRIKTCWRKEIRISSRTC